MKKKSQVVDVATMSPDERDALKVVVDEFMTRLKNVENEILTLKDDKKTLISEFSDKLDVKTLKACLQVIKIEAGVEHKSTFDLLMEVLQETPQS